MNTPAFSWVDGEPAARLSLLDRGLHYGDGLFETLVVRDARPRFAQLHLERALTGCRRLGLTPPDREALRAKWSDAARELDSGIVKCLLTRGDAAQRGYSPRGAQRTRCIVLGYREPIAPNTEPIALWQCTLRLGRNPLLGGLKTLNRLEQVLATREWQQAADERRLSIGEGLLESSDGHLVSGCSSNLFWRRGSRLSTPLIADCGVAGVMRRVVLREAQQLGVEVAELRATLDDLMLADEVFMTNVRWQLRPVARLFSAQGAALREWATPGKLVATLQPRVSALVD